MAGTGTATASTVCLFHEVFLLPAGLKPLGAFNVDVDWAWVTAPQPGAPSVLSSLLHRDPSNNQTW